MSKKIKELFAELEKAGFINYGGKGCYRNYMHPKGVRITLYGLPEDDAKPYQELEVGIKTQESEQ